MYTTVNARFSARLPSALAVRLAGLNGPRDVWRTELRRFLPAVPSHVLHGMHQTWKMLPQPAQHTQHDAHTWGVGRIHHLGDIDSTHAVSDVVPYGGLTVTVTGDIDSTHAQWNERRERVHAHTARVQLCPVHEQVQSKSEGPKASRPPAHESSASKARRAALWRTCSFTTMRWLGFEATSHPALCTCNHLAAERASRMSSNAARHRGTVRLAARSP